MMLPLLIFLMFPTISLSDDPNTCNPDDKTALLKIKNSFTNPNPFPAITPEMTDCCYLFECNENNRIIDFSIVANTGLAGEIPDAIGDLTYLKNLGFHKMPLLVGHIPRSITKLKYLNNLAISWTNVSGPVPEFLVQLKSLIYLDLSFNKLSGSIPPSIATLQNLTAVNLSRNKLIGPIPEFFAHFSINPNLFIVLSHNMLSGKIPNSFANKNYYRIDISRNNFSGDASMLFGKNGAQSLDISRNNFEFNFSNLIFNDGIIVLDVSHNKIYGGIPSKITEAIYLQGFNVSYNRLCGKIPTGWKRKYQSGPFDSSSYVHNRCLCGTPLDKCKP